MEIANISSPKSAALAPPHVDPEAAAQAVAAWVSEVASKEGVKATFTFHNYRVDITATGSGDPLRPAAETFLYGGTPLHEKG